MLKKTIEWIILMDRQEFPYWKQIVQIVILAVVLFFSSSALTANRTINLVIDYKKVNFTGKTVRAIAVNHQIPGPTLHFKEGDHVTINVYNHLDQSTSIHWHGVIVPWRMDGVPKVSQYAIPPGGVYHYRYTLHQSGTYWYHAHADFQEQEGLYGAYLIDPLKQTLHYNKDFVIVLSDWKNTKAGQVFDNLKKEGDFYSPDFPLQPSLAHFIESYHRADHAEKKKLSNAYWSMQFMRMNIYDFTDIAYDTFLLNGHTKTNPWKRLVRIGDTVRLRFIGASATTLFNVKIPGTKIKIVQVDGQNVKPYNVEHFSIGPGETYDAIVRIQKKSPTIIYAESSDTVGFVIGALVTNLHQAINYQKIKPFPEPGPVIMHGAHGHQGHQMKTSTRSTPTKYDVIQSTKITNNPNKAVHIIKMNLTGYMGQYIWFLNGTPEYNAKPIIIKPGEKYRVIFKNDTMMHHPMHIHGHWFIMHSGHGAHNPLLHTIDVPPGATVVADFNANTTGQWYFHCHNLFHMNAGMANFLRYDTLTKERYGNLTGNHNKPWYFMTKLDVSGDPFRNIYFGNLDTLIGPDYNKLQFYSEDAEINEGRVEDFDLDMFYWRLVSQFWAVKGGINYVYRPADTPYFQPGIGIEGLMPFFIDTNLRIYWHDGSTKFDLQLGRDTQLTNNFFLRLAIRLIVATKTVVQDQIGSGLNEFRLKVRPYYRLTPHVSIYAEYELEDYYGVRRQLRLADGESAKQNTITLGLSFLF